MPIPLDHGRRPRPAASGRPRQAPAAVLLAACCGGWLAGCAPSAHASARATDPLAALAAPVQSPTFDLAFWVQEQGTRSLLWRQAFAFCRLHQTLPNCRTVRMASWWGSPPPPTPAPATALPPAAPRPAPATVPFPSHRQTTGSFPAAPPPPPRSREGRHP